MTKLVNRAKMTTATTGTGTITLGSAVDGYQTFAAAGVANGNVVRYVIEDGDAWEIGTGTYTASGTTLSRTVTESSNASAALNLTGEAVVFVTAAGQDIVQPGDNVSTLTNDAGYTTNTGTVTSVGVTAGTGITVSGSPITSSGSITVTNAAPDQVVSLTGGSNVTVTGTYPSFTVAASGTNLGYTSAASAGTVTSSTGNNATLPAATTSIAGLLTSADKTKLDGIAAGAQVNVATNLGNSVNATSVTVTSSTGTNTTLPAATTTNAGVFVAADKTKLDGIQAGAQVNVATNLTYSTAATTGTVNSSTGTNATIPAATTSLAGLMTNADKTKLDGVEAGAQVNVATNLGYTTAASSGTVTSSTGTNATLPAATTSVAGLLTSADKTKLDGIAAGAQVNVGTNLGNTVNATSVTVTSSTGNNTTLPAATTSNAGVFVAADKTKLDGIEAGAQVNVGTNLSVTAGTTAGPTINSSTGNNATIPTASASASGAVTTGDQTFAGVKTFGTALAVTGTSKAAGRFYAGTTAPTNTTRLNYDGAFHATSFVGNGSGLTNLPAPPSNADYQEFTASGTWTKPAGVSLVYVEAIGGGGSGGSNRAGTSASGGGGGTLAYQLFTANDLGSTVTVTVGSGGASVSRTSGVQNGNSGGNSLFGTFLTGNGGGNGRAVQDATVIAPGGSGFLAAFSGTGGVVSPGENAVGGAGGGGRSSSVTHAGGVSFRGGNGGSGGTTSGVNGSAPGGGGGGASATSGTVTSGAGARGEVRVWAW